MESVRRNNKSLTEDTKGINSTGTVWASSGLRSCGSRARIRSSNRCRGLMACTSASHTSNTAKGRIANCGSITPLTISVASSERWSKVSATCTSAGCPGATGSCTQIAATLKVLPWL